MFTAVPLTWRDHLVLAREIEIPGDRANFFAQVRRGNFIAIHRGVYIRSETWTALDSDAKYRARIKGAAVFADAPIVFSHESAAALWRLPTVRGWPRGVHVAQPRQSSTRSNSMFIRHSVGVPGVTVSIEGLEVTSLARTVVDLATRAPFAQAVTFADAALRRTEHPRPDVPTTFLTRNDLLEELDCVFLRQGSARARAVVTFADGLADRPGESLSRVGISVARLTMPELQVRLTGASGRVYFVDFWWPEFNMIGEFDGKAKYQDPEFLNGRTPAKALADEKLREDDLRAAGHGMTRWSWDLALSPRLLRAHLVAAGIR